MLWGTQNVFDPIVVHEISKISCSVMRSVVGHHLLWKGISSKCLLERCNGLAG